MTTRHSMIDSTRRLRAIGVAVFVGIGSCAAWVADAQPPSAAASAVAMTPSERHDWERTHRVSKIIGSEVHAKSGEKIGDIRDLVLDDRGGILLAIVSTGGFPSIGERLHAVPWEALQPGPKEDRVLDLDKARLKAAPGFTSKTWPNLNDERWVADNRRYYLH
ncbi:MAG: PRC-barrel domain-containing protein [Burkholderiaceae bacterium]